MLSISGQPTVQLLQPLWPLSVAHCHVALKSFIVSGLPSDHFRPGRMLTSTVNVLPSGAMVTPFPTVGSDAARSGMYLPSDVIVARPRRAGVIASTVV